LKNKPEFYITIDAQSNVTGEFENFEEYLKHRDKL